MAQRDRRERFIELAEKRVSHTLRDLRLIGNLANRGNYDYDGNDVNQIFDAIDKELRRVRALFASPSRSRKEFRLRKP